MEVKLKQNLKAEKLNALKIELENLEQQEIELNGKNRKSYETVKMVVLIVLLMCIIFQTCYIKDSLDLDAGVYGADLDNQTDDDNGPYNLDNNKKNDDTNNKVKSKDNQNNKKINNKKNNNENNNQQNIINEKNNNQNSNSNNTISENEEEDIITQPVTQAELKKIKIIQDMNKNGSETKTDFTKLDNLEIFKNSEYFNEKLIYPGISDTYKFYIENYTDKNISYKLTFDVQNAKETNIKYKLKRNGKYIAGDENNYVNYTELTKAGLKLKSKNGDIYSLEWKWIEAENDNSTTNPITRGLYKLTIKGEVV